MSGRELSPYGVIGRVTWHRVSSNYDRDSDIFLAGLGYRF